MSAPPPRRSRPPSCGRARRGLVFLPHFPPSGSCPDRQPVAFLDTPGAIALRWRLRNAGSASSGGASRSQPVEVEPRFGFGGGTRGCAFDPGSPLRVEPPNPRWPLRRPTGLRPVLRAGPAEPPEHAVRAGGRRRAPAGLMSGEALDSILARTNPPGDFVLGGIRRSWRPRGIRVKRGACASRFPEPPLVFRPHLSLPGSCPDPATGGRSGRPGSDPSRREVAAER